MRLFLLLLFMLAVLSGASSCQTPRPASDLAGAYPIDMRLHVTSPALLLTRQPVDSATADPRQKLRGRPGRVVAPGAVVKRVALDDVRVRRGVNHKVDPRSHPWVYVSVAASPIPAQVGDEGWVHTDHLMSLHEARRVTNFHELTLTPELLEKPAPLCPWPDGTPEPQCPVEIHPSLRMRVLECAKGYAMVELWDPDGNYIAGYIREEHFQEKPCQEGSSSSPMP